MKKPNKSKSYLAVGLALMMTCLQGCGKEKLAAPELMEPVASTESYRTVSYGDVGTMKVEFATVVPTSYAHFWTASINISKVMVDVGDYVEEGSVLAVADVDSLNEQKSNLAASLTKLKEDHELQNQKYELNQQILQYRLKGEEELGETEAAEATKIEIQTEQENHRYDELMYSHQCSDMEKQITNFNDEIADGTLTARHSGYVSYAKDISNNSQVSSGENVVVISDYDDLYVEMNDVTIEKKIFENYDKCYSIVDGKKYTLQEIPYTAQECAAAENRSLFPKLRLQFEKKQNLQMGTVLPVYLIKNRVEEVLTVGCDSIYEDDNGSFVYVKKDQTREQRYIEIGERDSIRAEVRSGLELGEKVYYSSEAVIPDNYEEVTVQAQDFSSPSYTDNCSVTDITKKSYFSEYEGQVTSVMVSERDEVKKGDPIAVVATNEGSARLQEMRNGITSLKDGYEVQKQEHETRLSDLQVQRAECVKQEKKQKETKEETKEETATGSDAPKEDEAKMNPYQVSILDLMIQMEEIDFQLQTKSYEQQLAEQQKAYNTASCNNDGSGNCTIYAQENGNISCLTLAEGKKIEIGKVMFYIETQSKKKIGMFAKSNLKIGTAVKMKVGNEDKVYTGTVIGNSGQESNEAAVFLTTISERSYVTQSIGSNVKFFVQPDDESLYEKSGKIKVSYPVAAIEDTIVLPMEMVYSELIEAGKTDERYFVYRKVDGDLEKQYVNVQIFESQNMTSSFSEGSKTGCILDGVKSGDVLIREVNENEQQ